MSGADQIKNVLESSAGSAIRPGRAADDAILELLVHMASTDGVFDDAEIAMLERVLPDWSATQVRSLIGRVTSSTWDPERLLQGLHTEDQKWTALRFAARMAWKDEVLQDVERGFLEDLIVVLELPDGALERILREMTGPPADRLDPVRLRGLVSAFRWDAADFADGPVQSRDLLPHVPDAATPVMRVGVDQAEVMGIYAEGLVARFLEGPAFLPWHSIVGTTSGAGLESSVRLHTEDGRIWSLVDARMSGIKLVIDRLYRPDAPMTERTFDAPTTDETWDDSELE